VGLSRRVTLLKDKVDSAGFEDPVYDVAITSRTAGWGAGGSPADLKDQTDGQFRSVETSAVYKIASDPVQPASEARLDPPKPGVRFAVFGESWCGTGLCSSASGTGTMADAVSLQIRDEINRAARQEGGPRFVLYTGSMRRTGIPEELAQVRNYLSGFEIPVFAALGSNDRFVGQGNDPTGGQASGTSLYWRQAFADRPAPWGDGPAIAGFLPAASPVTPAIEGQARTHYAFDYAENGKRLLRVVVIDSSTRSYGTTQEQNPAEDQGTWLKSALTEASQVLRIPVIVTMNQPTVLPSDQQVPNWTTGQTDFESDVAASGTTAVITGGPRVNQVDAIKGIVPLYVAGGGGAPL
jgi:hypothetical protein